MKQIIIRSIFGVIILLLNILIILFVGNPKIPLFENYEIDLRVLVPFLGLLFLEPFVNLFNPLFCSVKIQNSTNESDDESTVIHKIEYRGKDPLCIKIIVISSHFDVECLKGEHNQEMFIPNHTKIYLSKDKPYEMLTFRLKRKESNISAIIGKKATIKYKKDYLTQKVIIR